MNRKERHMYKRADGRWEGRLRIGKNASGRVLYRYVYARTKKECLQKMREAALQLQAQPQSPQLLSASCSCKLTLRELSEMYLVHKAQEIKESSMQRYRHLFCNHIFPLLGEVRADRLQGEIIQRFLNEKLRCGGMGGRALSESTVRDIWKLIQAVLKFGACKFQNIAVPPDIRLPHVKQTKINTFTTKEMETLVGYVLRNPKPTFLGILLALNTGLRLGEVCGLQWKNIDFSTETLCVTQTVQRVNYGGRTELQLQKPKTEAACRQLPVPSELLLLLQKMRGTSPDTHFVFSGCRSPLEPRRMQRHFKTLLNQCGITYRNFHVMRHTFASRCVEAKVDVKTVSELMGHANPQTTLKHYVHATLDYKKYLVEKISILPSLFSEQISCQNNGQTMRRCSHCKENPENVVNDSLFYDIFRVY